MVGLVTMLRILVRQSTWTSITGASAFFSCFSRSGTSPATTSMTFIFSASSADRLTASRTARSAHSAFLPRILARPRMYAAASLICLRIKVSFFSSFSDPPPPRATGEAAPRLVPGAMAAMWLAYRMKVPALAARAPAGRDEAGDLDRRSEDVLDDLAHRGVEPAGRVAAKHHELRLVLRRALQRPPHEIGARRADRALEGHDEHGRRRGMRRRQAQGG